MSELLKPIAARRIGCLLTVLVLLHGCASFQGEPGDVLVLGDGTVFIGDEADRGAVQQALLAQFREWRGTPYRLGGSSRSGIDCSAFVQQTLSTHFSVKAPRSTDQQMQIGSEVSRNSMKVGDLVFFRTGKSLRHVGFYLGGGQFLHASTKVGVTISKLDDPYWRRNFLKARRVL